MKTLAEAIVGVPPTEVFTGEGAAPSELTRLAFKLREDLFNCEEKLSGKEFGQMMHSITTLIFVITGQEPAPSSAPLLKKDSQSTAFCGGKPSVPLSLH